MSQGVHGEIPRQVLVVMGVSGAGKSTVAELLRDRLGWPFQEGDELHPRANVEKMRAGQALTDADRKPWLEALAGWIAARRDKGEGGVVTCSALKRQYRDVLGMGRHDVRFVFLRVDRAELDRRVKERSHRYMPASLLESQLATLEEPGPGEHVLVVAPHRSPEASVADILAALRLLPG